MRINLRGVFQVNNVEVSRLTGGIINGDELHDVETLSADIFGNLDGLSDWRDGQECHGDFPSDNPVGDDGKSLRMHLLDKLDEIFQDEASLQIADRIDAVAVDVNLVVDMRTGAEAG